MEATEVASPRIFAPSTFNIDDSQLCFSKTHFSRPDFNVQRFMNLTRRRAGLDQIQKDLRLYLKSLQHSMIELINDDYADFVHLSSNLVCLHSNIDKLDKDLTGVWTEFESSTRDAVGIAEKVEINCEQLTANRSSQSALRNRIAFISSLNRLNSLIKNSSGLPSLLWLEKVSSCIVDISTHEEELLTEKEHQQKTKVLQQLDKKLCLEGVKSLDSDCATFPLILSVLTVIKSTDSFTSALVGDFLYPKLVQDSNDLFTSMMSVYKGVEKTRSEWKSALGANFVGNIEIFLDHSLLTFIQTFIDKKLGRVAVPSDTRLFHKCYLATQAFISEWPTGPKCRTLLKGIRDKFNLTVYFKLETHKFTRKLDSELAPESITLLTLHAIETVWDDDVYLTPLIDKLWEFTLRMASKHYGWIKAMYQSIVVEGAVAIDGVDTWELLLYLRTDAKLVHNKIFDLSLEHIWTKLRDLEVDTSVFGQCLTRLGNLIDAECVKYDESLISSVQQQVNKVLDSVCDIPKQYRWTRKPLPTTSSNYVGEAFSFVKKLTEKFDETEYPDKEKVIVNIYSSALNHFCEKAKEVLDGVDATGSSLSRFKRKGNAQEGVSDDDKIKAQINCDVKSCIETAEKLGLSCDDLQIVLTRSHLEVTERSQTPEVVPTASAVTAKNVEEEEEL
ncbi:unnamed protein product [Auanema sp. JU1783]|nr:unnamed protein product [Auanema sp. JU1783]